MIIYIDTEIEINIAIGPDYSEYEREKFKATLMYNSVNLKAMGPTKYVVTPQKCCLSEDNAMNVINALHIDHSECDFRFNELGEIEIRFNGYKTE